MRRTTRSLAGLVLLVLAACSTPEAPPLVVSVEFVSHADGQVVTGDRTIEVRANVKAPADAQVTGSHNGADLAFTRQGNVLRATVELANHDNVIEVTVRAEDESGVKTDKDTLTLHYPFVELGSGQPAAVVIGQLSPEEADPNAPEGMRVREPYYRPAYVNGTLYVPDSNGHRILAFDGIPEESGVEAAFVVGGPAPCKVADCSGANERPENFAFDADKFKDPGSLAAYGNGFIMTDTFASRILVFEQAPTDGTAKADRVLGQPDFTSGVNGCAPNKFRFPDMAIVVDGKLIVADTENHRVLIWNQFPANHNVPADLVLGQSSFVSCEPDRGGQPDADTLDNPQGVWSDGQRLIVADAGNRRVLIWNAFPTQNGQPADVVVGQGSFTTQVDGVGPSSLGWAADAVSNGNQLFVADETNNRVMVWNSLPTTNGAPADLVLGQDDMESSVVNRGKGVGPDTLNQPDGVAIIEGKLFVADWGNHRYVIYEPVAP